MSPHSPGGGVGCHRFRVTATGGSLGARGGGTYAWTPTGATHTATAWARAHRNVSLPTASVRANPAARPPQGPAQPSGPPRPPARHPPHPRERPPARRRRPGQRGRRPPRASRRPSRCWGPPGPPPRLRPERGKQTVRHTASCTSHGTGVTCVSNPSTGTETRGWSVWIASTPPLGASVTPHCAAQLVGDPPTPKQGFRAMDLGGLKDYLGNKHVQKLLCHRGEFPNKNLGSDLGPP